MIRFEIRAVDERGRDVIRAILKAHWGSTWIVGRGRLYDGESLPGLAAVDCENIIGLITYNIENESREIVSLNGLRERKGIGTALIDAVKADAKKSHCRQLRFFTTNDNVPAMEFYKRRGFTISTVQRGAIAESRKLKPGIALHGVNDVPITDEVEMEMRLK